MIGWICRKISQRMAIRALDHMHALDYAGVRFWIAKASKWDRRARARGC